MPQTAWLISIKRKQWYRQTSYRTCTVVGILVLLQLHLHGKFRSTEITTISSNSVHNWYKGIFGDGIYIFDVCEFAITINLNLIPGFNGLYRDRWKNRRGIFKCWDLVRLILEVWLPWYSCNTDACVSDMITYDSMRITLQADLQVICTNKLCIKWDSFVKKCTCYSATTHKFRMDRHTQTIS